ncbi:HAD-like domain-containing protein [Boletus edulis BED1]|uniref:HAD-like domain-containing protein n=1 Tax=Boletus edulis BED1 TaxID=1328754 RepID=A0AAD4GCS3_BOLED|nr:HAD-like domain-containing protein [Boletus edulis BED1]
MSGGFQTQPFYFDKKFVVLSDWDGTITTCDSNDYITDNYGMGASQRIALNMEILEYDKSGKTKGKSFKDAFELMLRSVSDNGHSLEGCKMYLTTPPVDGRRPVDFTDGFIDFKKFCDESDIPFTIVSSGMDELIRAVLTELAKGSDKDVVKDIAIVSNGVRRDATGKWFITWRHPDSAYGHDKSQAILPYQEYRQTHNGRGPTVFFFGDGVSDLSAAQHADILFVKVTGIDEKDNLKKHCDKAGIPYIPFFDFRVAKAIVGQIVRGDKTKDDFLIKPVGGAN